MIAEPNAADDSSVKRPGFLILRLFFAQFWLLQVYFKAHDAESNTTSIENLGHWATHLTAQFAKTTPLPNFMLVPYTHAVPIIELTLGVLLLVGFKTRWALLGAAAFLVSLDLGLMLQGEHDKVATNTIFLLALLWAAAWEKWNIWSVDQFTQTRARPS